MVIRTYQPSLPTSNIEEYSIEWDCDIPMVEFPCAKVGTAANGHAISSSKPTARNGDGEAEGLQS